ncbi:MAG: C25 family cysteine peptidase [Candidatus Lokiarchaeota archaeon]
MKKIGKILATIFLLIGLTIAGVSIPVFYTYFQSLLPKQSTHVNIYVNSTIYSSLSSEIHQYEEDIIAQGYSVTLINWSNNNVTALKNDLINASQQEEGLFGAVLIGDMPYANYKNGTEIFPCDLYLMDLDGTWVDSDPTDGYYDDHTPGEGDLLPEIWISRISTESMSGINHIDAYKAYFDRNHAYRTNNLNRPHSQLVYIDNDWSSRTDEWLGGMTAYSNITCVNVNSNTTASDYLSKLNETYEFVHLFVHSNSTEHIFGPNGDGTEGRVNYTQIDATYTKPLFYNLFANSACNYITQDNIGTHYLFSENTLAVIGSTKTGGMMMNSYFYTPLKQGKVLGEALRLWFNNPHHGPKDSLSQGMCLLGDGLLTISM